MSATPAGIAEADWLATPTAVRAFILAQQQENAELRSQLIALASELAPESRQVVEIPWGLSPGVAGAELTTAQGSGA